MSMDYDRLKLIFLKYTKSNWGELGQGVPVHPNSKQKQQQMLQKYKC